jgi:hypothetical protein
VLVKRRSAGEIAGLFVAFVVAGAGVTFGVLVIGSFLNLPHAALWVASVLGLAAIAYPIMRSAAPRDDAAPSVTTERTDHE